MGLYKSRSQWHAQREPGGMPSTFSAQMRDLRNVASKREGGMGGVLGEVELSEILLK